MIIRDIYWYCIKNSDIVLNLVSSGTVSEHSNEISLLQMSFVIKFLK